MSLSAALLRVFRPWKWASTLALAATLVAGPARADVNWNVVTSQTTSTLSGRTDFILTIGGVPSITSYPWHGQFTTLSDPSTERPESLVGTGTGYNITTNSFLSSVEFIPPEAPADNENWTPEELARLTTVSANTGPWDPQPGGGPGYPDFGTPAVANSAMSAYNSDLGIEFGRAAFRNGRNRLATLIPGGVALNPATGQFDASGATGGLNLVTVTNLEFSITLTPGSFFIPGVNANEITTAQGQITRIVDADPASPGFGLPWKYQMTIPFLLESVLPLELSSSISLETHIAFDIQTTMVADLIYADANFDGTVDIFDVAVVSNNWNAAGVLSPGDLNGDGTVDIFDVAAVSNNWGATAAGANQTAVPEPTSGALAALAAGGLIALRRLSPKRAGR